MALFSNEDYEILADDIIRDSFYSDNSYRGKIKTIRQYAEVIVRKILDINPDEEITLGKHSIANQIKSLPNAVYLEKAINGLKEDGNQDTHTKNRNAVSEEDYLRVTDSLFDMLAYLPISYFEKYGFGQNNEVLTAFSLLPPIIRYKVLDYLISLHPDNVSLIDKYVLILTKTEKGADAWVEADKDRLEALPSISEKAKEQIREKYGEGVANELIAGSPQNMYEVCKQKVEALKGTPAGKIYRTFEEAKPYYQAKGILDGNSAEIVEFNNMMEFLYLGRKSG